MANNQNEFSHKLKKLVGNRAVIVTVVTLLVVTGIVVAATVSANRAKKPPVEDPVVTTATTETQANPSGKEDVTLPTYNEGETQPTGGEPTEPEAMMILPVSGLLYKGHDATIQVYSNTMGDYRVHLGLDIATEPEEPEEETPYPTYELTENMEIIKEIAYAYRRQGTQIEYDQSNSRRHISPSPEDATAQHMIYLDCSSYVNAVYLEAFGVGIRSTGITANTGTLDSYAKERVGTDEVVGYWEPASGAYETAASRKAVYEEDRKSVV